MRSEINGIVESYVTYEHDDLNRITGVFDHDSAQVPANPDDWFKDGTVVPTEFDYNPLGQMTSITRPNDVDTSYVYGDAAIIDPLTGFAQNPFQVYSIVHQDTETTPVTLAQYDYSYDAVGNRTGMDITASDGSQTNITYDYDRANRMVEESYALIGGATSETSYLYDRAGNRTQMRQGGDTTRYSYNDNDELTRVDMPDYYFEEYLYDSRGNLTLVEAGGHGTYSATNYAYNARDGLISAIVPGSGTVTYDYDYLGNRVEQTIGGTVTDYLWDEFSRWGDVILETDPNNATNIVSYTLANGMLISQNNAGNVDYFLQDAQGSTVGIADDTGTVTSSYSYNAFGELDDSSTLETNYLYTGQQFDSETELYSLRARYYAPSVGRFMSRDTYAYDYESPFELNRYAYAANNPATFTDPSGFTVSIDNSLINTLISVRNFVYANRLGIAIGASVLLPVFALLMLQQRVGDVVHPPIGDEVVPPSVVVERMLREMGIGVADSGGSGGSNGSPSGGGNGSPWGLIIKSAVATGTIILLCALLCPKDDSNPDPNPTEAPVTPTQPVATATPDDDDDMIVRHYTDVEGYSAIISSGMMIPSVGESYLGPAIYFTATDPFMHPITQSLGYNRVMITAQLGLPALGRSFNPTFGDSLERSACFIDIQKNLLPPASSWTTRPMDTGRLEHIYRTEAPVQVSQAIVNHGSTYSLDPQGNSDPWSIERGQEYGVNLAQNCEVNDA